MDLDLLAANDDPPPPTFAALTFPAERRWRGCARNERDRSMPDRRRAGRMVDDEKMFMIDDDFDRKNRRN